MYANKAPTQAPHCPSGKEGVVSCNLVGKSYPTTIIKFT